MAIRNWIDEYNSGIAYIDAQNKRLFQMINAFEEKKYIENDNDAIASLFEEFLQLFKEHIKSENELMESGNYQLTNYHKRINDDFVQRMTELLRLIWYRQIETPYAQVVNLSAAWMEHFVTNDLPLFYYCNNSDPGLGDEIIDRACEIYSLGNNAFLCRGKFLRFKGEEIEVTCKNDKVHLMRDEIVKISTITRDKKSICFIARVNSHLEKTISISYGVTIKSANDRDYYRVAVALNATLSDSRNENMDAKIRDISGGGLMLETQVALMHGDEVTINFKLEDSEFSERCKVVRLFKSANTQYRYGMSFVNPVEQAKLMRDLFQIQAKRV